MSWEHGAKVGKNKLSLENIVIFRFKETRQNSRGQSLAARYWYPPPGKGVSCLVYFCHGFSEHLGLYWDIGNFLSSRGAMAFGHDHVGHGRSDGKRAYIEDIDHYVEDVIDHCNTVSAKYPDLPIFMVAHSMGGMIAIRCVLKYPQFFKGMVLNGPLIVPGPQVEISKIQIILKPFFH